MNRHRLPPAPNLDQLRWNRFELVCLVIPLARAVLYVCGFAPAQLDESLVAQPVQAAALCLLGAAAFTGLVGVLKQWPIVERAGLHLLWPMCVAYAIVLVAASWRGALLSTVIYGAIALSAWSRAGEITRSMRVVNRWLADPPPRPSPGPGTRP